MKDFFESLANSFLDCLKTEEDKTAYTENGAVSNSSTDSECLNLFYRSGGLRNSVEDSEIFQLIEKAYLENANKAMKIFFYIRDIRGGLGERKVFRTIMRYLAENHTDSVRKNLIYFSEYGRWDDLLYLYDTSLESDITRIIKEQLENDIENMKQNKEISLLAKWLPSVNTSSANTRILAKKLLKVLGYQEKEYRKTLSALRKYLKIVENNLREKDYSFEYSQLPSKAMFKYRNAFIRNDNERYTNYLEKVQNGEENLNTSTLYPYEIVRSVLTKKPSDEELNYLDTAWENMKQVFENENALAVVDGSGSMYSAFYNPRPIDVALSLGIYFAEKSNGRFKNHFITFSSRPKLVKIKGKNIYEKVNYCKQFNEVANTDIQAVFELILKTAVNNNLSQSELPKTLFIISDMEFDHCMTYGKNQITNFENAKRMFEKEGYKLPQVVFWNVASRNQHFPVKQHDSGSILVSGSSASIFDMVQGNEIDPMDFMNKVIESERYSVISA